MFKLNEAPNTVLAAINSQETSRSCGMFWSVLCCLPTFGVTIGCCDNRMGTDWLACCYPQPLSQATDVTLNVLVSKLNEIRMSDADIKKDSQGDERKVIEWQVKETIKLLETVISENVIGGSYRTAIGSALNALKTKATQEEKYAQLLDIDKIPLATHELYVPSYGMMKK